MTAANQPQPGFVNERGGLQGLALLFTRQPSGGAQESAPYSESRAIPGMRLPAGMGTFGAAQGVAVQVAKASR